MYAACVGTVLCPHCDGKPHRWSWTPNMAKLFRTEPPFWLRTLQRMDMLGNSDVSAAAHRRHRALASGPGDEPPSTSGSGQARRFGEVPHQAFRDEEIQAALDSTGEAWRSGARGGVGQDYGPLDPLGHASLSAQEIADSASRANPLTGNAAIEAAMAYRNLNPARAAARQLRELRQLEKASAPAEATL